MAISKNTRAGKRAVRKTTESRSTHDRDWASRVFLKDAQPNYAKRLYFCEKDRDLPIAGTPQPLSCPFCGEREVSIVFDGVGKETRAYADCEVCGIEGPSWNVEIVAPGEPSMSSYELALKVANLWNTRSGGVK